MGAVATRVTLSATGKQLLVAAGTGYGLGGWQIGIVGSGWTGSGVLKNPTSAPGSTLVLGNAITYYTMAGASSTAAISASATVIVQDTGQDLYFDYTHTSGSVTITVMAAGELIGQQGGYMDVLNPTYSGSLTGPAFAVSAAGAVTGVTSLVSSAGITDTSGSIISGQIAGVATGSFEARGTEASLRLQKYDNTTATEVYVSGFSADAVTGANNRKMGSMAFNFTNTDATTGYFSWNVHTTKLVAGVSTDDYHMAAWGGHGVTFFPAGLTSGFAPGDKIVNIQGALTLTGAISGGLSVAVSDVFSQSADGGNALLSPLTLRNTNAGNAAFCRATIGNDASAAVADLAAYSSGHLTRPDYVRLLNQRNAPLLLGGYGLEMLSLGNAAATLTGTLAITGAFGCNAATAQTAYVSGGAASTTGSTVTTPYGYTTSAQADGIVTLLNNIRAALVANGIMS